MEKPFGLFNPSTGLLKQNEWKTMYRMPPKKKEEVELPTMVGRVGTNLKVGIVGLPNVGVPVPDIRYDFLCDYFKPQKVGRRCRRASFRHMLCKKEFPDYLENLAIVIMPSRIYKKAKEEEWSKVPAFLNVVDIAGLVKGASEGQGLGNAFLSHISACDALFHLTRAFEDEDVTHVEGDVNPVRDLGIICDELRLKDIEFVNNAINKLEKNATRTGDKKMKFEFDILIKIKSLLVDDERHLRFIEWNTAEIEVLNKYLFLTAKPLIYLVNLSEKDYIRKKNKWLSKIKDWVAKNDPKAMLIPFSGAFESKLVNMPDDEKQVYMKEVNTTRILKIVWTDKISNKEVIKRIVDRGGWQLEIMKDIKRRKMQYCGYIIRAEGLQSNILLGRLEGKRSRGRLRKKWLDDVKKWGRFTKVSSLMTTAKDRVKWKSVVHATLQMEDAT
ncbi:Obg-like ATPase 1 [Nymphon striatum]|nr:Obg-like ATPase 1 [Nymphon striatum]